MTCGEFMRFMGAYMLGAGVTIAVLWFYGDLKLHGPFCG